MTKQNPYVVNEPDHCMHVVNYYDVRRLLLIGPRYWFRANGTKS
jgi:hypothetical protein